LLELLSKVSDLDLNFFYLFVLECMNFGSRFKFRAGILQLTFFCC